MTKRIESGAVQIDTEVCNALDLPVAGCHAGGGVHVEIPANWRALILANQEVPGCTYHALEHRRGPPASTPPEEPPGPPVRDALTVSDQVIARLADPDFIIALPPRLHAQAPLLIAKLDTATELP